MVYRCTPSYEPNIESTSCIRSAELYLSIPQHKRDALVADSRTAFSTSTPARAYSPRPLPAFAASPAQAAGSTFASGGHKTSSELSASQEREAELGQADEATLLAAQSYVTSKDLSRAVHVLRNCQSVKARFLSIYCQFLVGTANISCIKLTNNMSTKISEKKTERDWYKHYSKLKSTGKRPNIVSLAHVVTSRHSGAPSCPFQSILIVSS